MLRQGIGAASRRARRPRRPPNRRKPGYVTGGLAPLDWRSVTRGPLSAVPGPSGGEAAARIGRGESARSSARTSPVPVAGRRDRRGRERGDPQQRHDRDGGVEHQVVPPQMTHDLAGHLLASRMPFAATSSVPLRSGASTPGASPCTGLAVAGGPGWVGGASSGGWGCRGRGGVWMAGCSGSRARLQLAPDMPPALAGPPAVPPPPPSRVAVTERSRPMPHRPPSPASRHR
jgi:hypothetical protein